MKKLLLALGLVLASSAFAFVMPAWSILKHLAQNREDLGVPSFRIDGLVSFHGSAVKDAGAALGLPTDRPEIISDASFSMKLPGRCRLDFMPLEGTKAAMVDANGKRRKEGGDVNIAQAALSPVCALLGARTSNVGEAISGFQRFLQQRKVTVVGGAGTWLARFGGDVAYVIGSRTDTDPQFWVFKDSFLPARLRWTDEQAVAWDVRFYDYASPASGDWFPRILEVHRNGEMVMRFTSLKADSKAALPDKLF